MRNTNRGFTLVELLLSIATIGVLSAITAPVWSRIQTKNDLDVAMVTLAHSLRRAQALSVASDGDSVWGVETLSGSITVFKGGSYATRDTTYDEVFDLPAAITVGGPAEITFSKLLGVPSTTGTISLTDGGDSANIVINSKGTVSF